MAEGWNDTAIERQLADMYPDHHPRRYTIGRWRGDWEKVDSDLLRENMYRLAARQDRIANAKLDEIEDEIEATGKVPLGYTQVFVPWGITRDKVQRDQQLASKENEAANWQMLIQSTMAAMLAAGKNPGGAFARLQEPIEAEVKELPADPDHN